MISGWRIIGRFFEKILAGMEWRATQPVWTDSPFGELLFGHRTDGECFSRVKAN
jgi:hypothetical protein